MKTAISLDCNFYNQYECSLEISTIAKGDEVSILELALFSNVALRQLVNLGNMGISLGSVLSVVNLSIDSYFYYSNLLLGKTVKDLASLVPIIISLGVDVEKLIPFMTPFRMSRLQSGYSNHKIANEFWPKPPTIVIKGDRKASKQFNGKIMYKNREPFFEFTTSGFGLFGRGINYYAPVSVALLLNYLESKNTNNLQYCTRLVKLANYCGKAFLHNQVSMKSLPKLPFLLVEKVIKEVT